MSDRERQVRSQAIVYPQDKSVSVSEAISNFVENLAVRLAKNRGLETSCRYCWMMVDSAFSNFDNFFRPIFDDPRWELPRLKTRVNLLGSGA